MESKKPKTYEVVETRMFIPAEIADGMVNLDGRLIAVKAAKTVDFSLAGGEANHQALLAECKKKFEAGDWWAVGDLLKLNPWFHIDPWVQETLQKIAMAVSDGKIKKRSGRKKGSGQLSPIEVFNLVSALLPTHIYEDRIFKKLGEFYGVTKAQVKAVYYRFKKSPELKPITFEDTRTVREISEEEAFKLASDQKEALEKDGNLFILDGISFSGLDEKHG